MTEIALMLDLPNLVEVVHVELPDEGGVVAMLEVEWQHSFGEEILI